MKFKILCPKCGTVLKDKFSCPECNITLGGWDLAMECTTCEKYYDISIDVTLDPVSKMMETKPNSYIPVYDSKNPFE